MKVERTTQYRRSSRVTQGYTERTVWIVRDERGRKLGTFDRKRDALTFTQKARTA